jgi:hypothetical protein
MTSGITSTNYPTIFTVEITLRYSFAASTVANLDQLIMQWPTLDGSDNYMFPFDLGTGYTNGEYVDCWCP